MLLCYAPDKRVALFGPTSRDIFSLHFPLNVALVLLGVVLLDVSLLLLNMACVFLGSGSSDCSTSLAEDMSSGEALRM